MRAEYSGSTKIRLFMRSCLYSYAFVGRTFSFPLQPKNLGFVAGIILGLLALLVLLALFLLWCCCPIITGVRDRARGSHALGTVTVMIYSGTSLLWTLWGPSKVSCIERCPHFKGKFILREHIWDIVKCP